MLQEIFFETFESVNDYAIKNYISHPLVYQKLKDMRTRLADKKLTVTKNSY
ncbi:helix-turn-helix domain-containing protein [Enterococcus mundtii]|nr:helix-turn-helix domain-containing protein [Enterococcus mundtii]